MFTNHRIQTFVATAVAGVIGTVGLVAAGADENSQPSSTPTPPAQIAPASTDSTDQASHPAEQAPAPTPDPSPAAGHSATDQSTPGSTAALDNADAAPEVPAAPVESEAAPTTVPPPVDPEPPAPTEPGVITGDDDPTPPPPAPPMPGPSELVPVPKPMPPKPAIPGPVDLVPPPIDPGPGPIDDLTTPIDPTPIDGPGDFQVAPLPGHVGTLSSGLTGCELDCVTSALLSSNDFNASVHLAVEATVPVHIEVEITKTGTDSSEWFGNAGYDTSWETNLTPLQPDTTYDLVMLAIDQDGHSKVFEHQFTTVDIIDGFAGNAVGCALECITVGQVNPTEAADKVQVHVKTNTPAALQVWFSTSEPTWVDDPDAKPAHAAVHDNENPSTSSTFDVGGLEYDTLYHVVARAHDAHGEHYRIGTFQTGPQPYVDVLVTFEEITVTHDGDKGDLNKGELAFSWGFDGIAIGHRSEQKMHAGHVDIDGSNQEWFRIDPNSETIPNITVGAHERDWDGLTEFCSHGFGPGTEARYVAECDTKINVARLGGPITLDQILSFPKCFESNLPGTDTESRCAIIGSAVFGTRNLDYAHFTAVVSFDIA